MPGFLISVPHSHVELVELNPLNTIKGKIDKLNLIKCKNFYSLIDTVKKT